MVVRETWNGAIKGVSHMILVGNYIGSLPCICQKKAWEYNKRESNLQTDMFVLASM
jgi:hypothetical protein